ncbi:MBOAT, membrane-bound o-acyltransferase family domain-containing protein [Phthorimaea operculella]|nr:MBOAT, membrane-bound o-acyltransferase family domain-containing protein [Phthorimaea operculella]
MNVFIIFKLYNSQTEMLDDDPYLINGMPALQPGWSFLPRLKDTSDDEWSSYKYLFGSSWPFLLAQFIVTEIIRNTRVVRMLPPLALCGGGLWMGAQFHMKYIIIYGTTTAFARLDNIEPPPTPRCIARIHVYSEMWKYFDVGLYRFLAKYIYRPGFQEISNEYDLPKLAIKMMASFATFAFVFMWHGAIKSILVWSILNYLVVSNFYLFADTDVGDLFFESFYDLSFTNLNTIIISVALYCCCVVSMALQDVPSRTYMKKLHNNNISKSSQSKPIQCKTEL